jgi:hypothetical protein
MEYAANITGWTSTSATWETVGGMHALAAMPASEYGMGATQLASSCLHLLVHHGSCASLHCNPGQDGQSYFIVSSFTSPYPGGVTLQNVTFTCEPDTPAGLVTTFAASSGTAEVIAGCHGWQNTMNIYIQLLQLTQPPQHTEQNPNGNT